MSLRSFRDQLAAEILDEEAFAARMGEDLAAFEALSTDDIAGLIPCPRHVAAVGEPCGSGHGLGPFVCIERHIFAARLGQ